jgi:predicted nucleic-acid-binding Zn-ribbon protein
MEHKNYQCPRCENRSFETDEMSTTGGAFTRIFDIQNRRFITISCSKCGYTELFRKPKGKTWENILDFFTT